MIRFFDENIAWLAGVIEQGIAEGTLRPSGSPEEAAQALLGGLEGAMLVARPYGDVKRFEAAAAGLLTSIPHRPDAPGQ